jgi:hypothetical protein
MAYMLYIYSIHKRRIKRIQYLAFMAYMADMPYIYLIHVLKSTAYNGICVRFKKKYFFFIKKSAPCIGLCVM